jgi:hypothetical protein
MSNQTIHLIKLCVGAKTIDDLRARQGDEPYHITRTKPKRADDILACGGSMYWVIQRLILCRQKILRFEAVSVDGTEKCKIVFENQIIPVTPWPRKPFQGWRYLEDAPSDIERIMTDNDNTPLPASLSMALDSFGVR